MNIIVNGKEMNVENSITIEKLLNNLKIKDKVMAVALNMNIIKQDEWSKKELMENDKLELLHFVGGG